MIGEKTLALKRMLGLAVAILMLGTALFGIVLISEDSASGATSVGTIRQTDGTTNRLTGVNYLLDGDIEVSNSNSVLIFENSTITISQDVGLDGEIGGSDDHIYQILVDNSGTLIFKNSTLTTETGQIHPYFAMDITVDGSGSSLILENTIIEGPGSLVVTNSAHFEMKDSHIVELSDKSEIGYDIDGDGGVEDDKDYNDDGIAISLLSGSSGLIIDSQVRDTFSFSVPSRDGMTAGNITLDGSGTNLTVINSFLDVDFDSNTSTGSHNMLKLSGGAVAHLVGVTMNRTGDKYDAAVLVEDSASKALYYRWIGAKVSDSIGVDVTGQKLAIERIEGGKNVYLTSTYLTSEILEYMGKTGSNWAYTESDGWAVVPVVTDLFTYDSMPNSHASPDFIVSMTRTSDTVKASAKFDSYPAVAGQGEEIDLISRVKNDQLVHEDLIADLGGPLEFNYYVIDPDITSFFSGNSISLNVNTKVKLTGTTAIINGKIYPSYYSFNGHLVVSSGGHLTINDTAVRFLTGKGPAYILVESGGILELNNVSLAKSGSGGLYTYLLGDTGSAKMMLTEGSMDVAYLAMRGTSSFELHGKSFNSSINAVGSDVTAFINSKSMNIPVLFGRYSAVNLTGGKVDLGKAALNRVLFGAEDAIFSIPLDLSGDSELVNVSYVGNLPAGRTHWIQAVGNAKVKLSYKVTASVVDSVQNPLPGAQIDVSRMIGTSTQYLTTVTTDSKARAVFPLLETEITSAGSVYLGNYRLEGKYRGFTSNPRLSSLNGSDFRISLVVPGGPNLVPVSIGVNGSLITGNLVRIIGNVTNNGPFDSDPFNVELLVNGESAGIMPAPPLGAGEYTEVSFPWECLSGEVEMSIDVDPADEVREIAENDNLKTSMNVIGDGPDYSITLLVEDNVWAYGTKGDMTIEIFNDGDIDPSETPFHVDITWQGLDDEGIVASGIPFNYIEPGKTVYKTINWTPPASGPITVRAEVIAPFDQVPLNSWDSIVLSVKTLPDLRIRDGSFVVDSYLPVTVNTNVSVSFDVINMGELPSGEFSILLYDNLTKIEEEPRVPALEPMESYTVSFDWKALQPIGFHKLYATLDYMDEVKEQDEENEWNFSVKVDTEPDIALVSDIGFNPNPVTDGRNATIWIHVKNLGNTMARDVEVRFSLDSEINILGTEVINLLPGQMRNLTLRWSAKGPGTHSILLFADHGDDILETDESNNFKSKDILVLTKPDITMNQEDLQISPKGMIEIGSLVYLNATIWNKGQTDASTVIVRFYDGNPELGGRIIPYTETQPSVNIEMIRAGSWHKVSLTWKANIGGSHKIYVVMDLSNLVVEKNEDNNIMSWDLYVKTLPELSFSDISFYQGGFLVNSSGVDTERDQEDMLKLTINVTLVNTGDSPAGEFSVTFFNGNPIQDSTSIEIGEIRYPSGVLPGHASKFLEYDWNVDYPKGIRNIYVTVSLLEGSEQNTDNNFIFAPLEVFDINDVPELHVETDSLLIFSNYLGIDPLDMNIGEEERRTFVGMNHSISFNITNIGGKAASNLTVHFISSNLTDTWIEHSYNIPILENEGTALVTGFWNIRDMDVNELSIIVDPDNSIREFDEGNNLLTYKVKVEEAPDLTVRLIKTGDYYNYNLDRFEMTKGKSYTVSFDIINSGNLSYNGIDVYFSGPASNNEQTISVDANSTRRVVFNIEPASITTVPYPWTCTVNRYANFFEADLSNNEDEGYFLVTEEKDTEFPWIIIVVVLVVIVLVVIGIVFFVVTRMQKGDMAKCSNCGGLVEMEASICPHCGIEFSDEVECDCGEIIPPGSTECPSCGKPVEVPEAEKDEESEVEGSKEEGPAAKSDESEEEEFEEEELEEFTEEDLEMKPGSVQEEEEMAECFECGSIIPISAPICPHCGAVFE
ncbi:MAG: CARDB domain-containing protein [Thermoplasmatota archaeon]